MIALQKDGGREVDRRLELHRGVPTRLADETGVTPAVNQIEMHPYFPQEQLRAFHAEHGIIAESWSPLGRGIDVLTEPAIASAGHATG